MGLCQWMAPIVPPAEGRVLLHRSRPLRAASALGAPLPATKTPPPDTLA